VGFVQQADFWVVHSIISSKVKVFNLVSKIFLLIPILFPFQFTKQAVIETYTLFLSNFKTATEAIKTTCQAKPAFSRFLEVNKKIALPLKLHGTVHATLRNWDMHVINSLPTALKVLNINKKKRSSFIR
jgi:hypothetical protein